MVLFVNDMHLFFFFVKIKYSVIILVCFLTQHKVELCCFHTCSNTFIVSQVKLLVSNKQATLFVLCRLLKRLTTRSRS